MYILYKYKVFTFSLCKEMRNYNNRKHNVDITNEFHCLLEHLDYTQIYKKCEYKLCSNVMVKIVYLFI